MRLQKRLWPNFDTFTDSDAGDGRQYPVGSLIVRPGCTFYQFHETHYNGGWNVYEGKFHLTKHLKKTMPVKNTFLLPFLKVLEFGQRLKMGRIQLMMGVLRVVHVSCVVVL